MQASDVTAQAGAVPAKGQVPDPPTGDKKEADADSSPEVVVDKEGKPLPWNEQPKWKAARAAEKKLNDLLKANDLDDPDDLVDLVKSGRAIKGKLTDLDRVDELITKAAKLDSYEAYWAEQKKRTDKESLDPNERAEKAERELEQERNAKKFEAAQKRQVEETKRAIEAYESEVTSLIKETGVSKQQEPFILELFGVNNPSNDVDLTDRKAIKRLVADGVKRVEAFKQSVIAEYLAEKKGIVKTGQGSESVTGEKTERMGLKDAHKIAKEQIVNLFRGAG